MTPDDREFVTRLVENAAEETRRHFGVVAEGLRSEIRLVAEGVDRTNEHLEHLEDEARQEFTEMRSNLEAGQSPGA